jgi:hypothetical protein
LCGAGGTALIAQTDDDGAQVGLAVEPRPGCAHGGRDGFEGDGSSQLFLFMQRDDGLGTHFWVQQPGVLENNRAFQDAAALFR